MTPRRALNLTLALALAGACVAPLRAQSARVRAMGGAGIAIPDLAEDSNFVNPSALSQVDRMHVAAGGTANERDRYESDHISMTGLLYEAASERRVTLEDYLESDYEFRSEPERVSNWTYGFAYSQELRSPELNQALGREFLLDEAKTVRFNVATRFPIAERLTSRPELYAGATVRMSDRSRRHVSLNTQAKATQWNVDVSGFYKATERLTVGSVIRSALAVNTDDSAGAREESASLDMGAAYVLGERRDTIVALDFRNMLNASRGPKSEIRAGVERQFLDNDFALRLGSRDGTLTLGFGVKFFEDFRMDYSYLNNTEIREHHVSFRLPISFN